MTTDLLRLRGGKKGMNPAAAVVDPPAAAGRTRTSPQLLKGNPEQP